MQISRSADADWPTNRPTSSLRCSGCWPTRRVSSCCGRSPIVSWPSTNSPDGRQARAVGVATPGEAANGAVGANQARRHPGVLPAGERSRPPARHRRGAQRRTRDRRRARTPPRRRRTAAASRRGDGLMGLGHSHDHTHSVDDATRDSAAGIRAVKISLIVLGLTAAAQLAVVAVSGSVALFADTVHNFSDALTAVPLWIAFAMSRRAATRRYTYGFGRVEDLAGLFVVAVIAISAVVAAVEAVRRLVDPVPLAHLGWVTAAGIIGFLGNEVVAVYRIRVGNRIGSGALRADGMHARADGLTSLAVVAGAIGAALGSRGRSDRRSGDRGRYRRGVGLRGTRCVRQAGGPGRPRPGRQRCHGLGRPAGSPRGPTGQNALGRSSTRSRRRTRRRPVTEPGRRACGRPWRRT